jgi:DNA-binding NarL/FixJ family response regulator
MPTDSSTRTPLSVVIIDDTDDLRLLVGMALKRHGGFHVVAEAADGAAGVEAVKSSQPDLVLLDIAMPVMDGLQALPLIRHECPTAVIVMVSGFGDSNGMAQRAMTLGAAGYIQKGGRLQALPEQLRVIVGSATAESAARLARHHLEQAGPTAPF